MPRRTRRLLIALIGIIAGAAVGVLYLYLLLRVKTQMPYVQAAIIGAACGLILVTIPGLIWAVLRSQWYRIQLRQWTDKAQVLATAARRELQEDPPPEDQPHLENDLGVVDFLQRRYAEAAALFEGAGRQGLLEPRGNLLAALAETGQWEQLKQRLEGDDAPAADALEANLARLSAQAADEEITARLWSLAQQRPQTLLLNNLGVRAMQRGDYKQAGHAFELALEQKPAYAYAHANLGVLAYRRGDLKMAVSKMASAAGLVAEDEVVFSNLGGLLALAGDKGNAEKWLQRAHRIQLRHGATLINLGLSHHLNGRDEEALETLQAAALVPEFKADAEYNLGCLYYDQGFFPQALEHLKLALAERDDDPDILNNLGCVLFKQGHYQDAYAYFERVAKVNVSGFYRRNVIRAELGAGRVEEAAVILDKLGDDKTVSLERGLVALLRATQMKGETETHKQMIVFNLNAATSAFTEAIALGQSPLEASFNNGLAQYLRGEYRSAAETFAQALKRATDHSEMHYAAAISYIYAGMREAAEHEALATKELPGPVRELYLKARPHLEKAAESPAIAETAIYDLGLLNYMLGEYQRAIDVLRKIVRNDSPTHLVNALAVSQARLAQELQLTAQTATLMPEGKKKEIRAQAGKLLASAIYYFQQALRMAPEASLTHANVGLALMLRNQKGDVEAALNHWQLMHRHGDARARKMFGEFMQAQSPDAAQRLRFQDVELVFRPLKVQEWVVLVPPTMSPVRYIIEEIMDVPEWQLQAYHPLVKRSLRYRRKAERVRRKLRRLAI